MIRFRYATPGLPPRYGIAGIASDPLLHLDALIAARCRCIDLSDYEAVSGVFPIVFRGNVDRSLQYALWDLERPGPNASEQLDRMRTSLPVPIDYVLVVADGSSPAPGRDRLLAGLASEMQAVSPPARDAFIQAYRRTRER